MTYLKLKEEHKTLLPYIAEFLTNYLKKIILEWLKL